MTIMTVVIQCAASKRPHAGSLRTADGRKVLFVADPAAAPPDQEFTYARPDDVAEDGRTWREHLTTYNEAGGNPLGLLRAFELYENPAYGQMVSQLGIENIYILSAGWGLIRADFLTPLYDITFSSAVKKSAPWKYRRRTDVYRDLSQIPKTSSDEVVFFGGKDYVTLFCALTDGIAATRTVFYNSDTPPRAPGCNLERFQTSTRTNWQYEGARWFLSRAQTGEAVARGREGFNTGNRCPQKT